MRILVSTHASRIDEYQNELANRIENSSFPFEIVTHSSFPSEIDVIIYEPSGAIQDFTEFTGLKFVQSIWAGVDRIIHNPTLKAPLCRMVDRGLVEGMREYVLAHILSDQMRLAHYQKQNHWDDSLWSPLSTSLTIGIIGAGNLGVSVGQACMNLGYKVKGWTRTEQALPFESCFGFDALYEMLPSCDYVVTLLPHTPETENMIDTKFLRAMKPSALLINPARGALLDEPALIHALDHHQIRGAVLDVFKIEPLPLEHVFWTRDEIKITPHIAAKSRVETACETIMANLIRYHNGEALLHIAEKSRGY